jgi:tetratricopeptide (TPR) repeat protein
MATEFKIPLHRFDVNLLPPEARQVGTEAFKTAVMLHFAAEYAAQGQTVLVTVDDSDITVMAFRAEATALDFVLPMLHAGKVAEAIPYLESLTKSAPANATVLYNLGIAYSELGQFDEAIIRLKRAVQLDSGHAHAWVGIGNAYYRMHKPEQALQAFEKAVELNPDDGYTHRNLGGILVASKRNDESLVHLRKALKLMPDDPQSIFGLAIALEEVGTDDADEEADDVRDDEADEADGPRQRHRRHFAERHAPRRARGTSRRRAIQVDTTQLPLMHRLGSAET